MTPRLVLILAVLLAILTGAALAFFRCQPGDAPFRIGGLLFSGCAE